MLAAAVGVLSLAFSIWEPTERGAPFAFFGMGSSSSSSSSSRSSSRSSSSGSLHW